MRTKIIFLFTPGPIGGAEKVVVNGVQALKHLMDIELWIIKEERVSETADCFLRYARDLGVECKTFSSYHIFDLKLFRQLKDSFKGHKHFILHAHGFKASFYGKLCGVKNLVVTHHGKTGHTLKVRIYEFLEWLVMKRSSAVIAVSAEMKRALIRSGIKAHRVHLVENFMTSQVVQKKLTESSRLKLLFAGRLSPEKGCESLLMALHQVQDSDIDLEILGDGIEREKLKSLMSSYPIPGKVFFHGFQKNVTEFMAASDGLVMPSYREGQPLTLIEACTMGLPVLASNVGGIPELVESDRNGILFEAGQTDQIAESLRRFKSKKEILALNAQELKHDFVARFSVESWAKNTSTVYQRVLNQE